MAQVFIILEVKTTLNGHPYVVVESQSEAIVDPMLGCIKQATSKRYSIRVADASIAEANKGKVWAGFNIDNFDIQPSKYTGLDGEEHKTDWLYPRR